MDIGPADSSLRVDDRLGADLNPDHLTGLGDGINQIRETPAWSAADVENTVSWLQSQFLNGSLSQGFDKEEVEIGKGRISRTT
jgi:hypothetical protein